MKKNKTKIALFPTNTVWEFSAGESDLHSIRRHTAKLHFEVIPLSSAHLVLITSRVQKGKDIVLTFSRIWKPTGNLLEQRNTLHLIRDCLWNLGLLRKMYELSILPSTSLFSILKSTISKKLHKKKKKKQKTSQTICQQIYTSNYHAVCK